MRHPHGEDSDQPSPSIGDHPPHYNPNQPRVPAGHHGGGQWTRGGFGHNDPIVRLAFEDRTDPLRRIDSPPLAPTQAPAPAPRPQVRAKGPVRWGLAALIGALLGQKDPDQQPVLVFRVRDNWRDSRGVWQFESLQNVRQDDINEICGKQIEDLQRLLDEAVEQVESEGKNRPPGAFATRAHQVMKEMVDALKKAGLKDMAEAFEEDDLKTEFLIAKDEDGNYKILDRKDNPKGSLRSDLGHFKGIDTVCITDYKFGERGLDNAKIEKILQKIKEVFPKVTRILITEAKPTWSPLFKPK